MKRPFWIAFSLIALSLIALVGCSKKPPVRLTAAADGQRVVVQPGQEVELRLEANPSTGYRWEIVDGIGPALQALGEPSYQSEDRLGKVGAGGTATWRFRVVQASTDTLRLLYKRPWEPNGSPARTFACVIDVR